MRPKFRFDFLQPAYKAMKATTPLQCSPDMTAFAAGVEMGRQGRHSMVVLSPKTGRLAGILSERDFLTKLPLKRGAAHEARVADLMTPVYDITLGRASCTSEDVVRRMRRCSISTFPLVEDDGETVRAVVNMRDIAEQIFNQLNENRDVDGADVSVGEMMDFHAKAKRDGDVRGTRVSLPPFATVKEAVELMRSNGAGSLIIFAPNVATHSHFVVSNTFGLFTVRDYLNAIHLYDDRDPEDIELFEVARFSKGNSKTTMKEIHDLPTIAHDFTPDAITAVTRDTSIRDCLSLMLGNSLLYAPITENKTPIDVVSLRDINLFLAPVAEKAADQAAAAAE